MNHTPGPWQITKDTTRGEFVTYTKVRDGHDGVIAVMHINEDANARLIAAAPELLAALEAITKAYVELVESDYAPRWNAENDSEVISARAAIAKAKGGAL